MKSDYLARLQENLRVLVRGGAGTGKTLLALEEAARAARSGARVLFLCFNRLLADSLVTAAPAGVTVSTLHSLMASLIRDAHLEGELPDADQSDLYEVFFPLLSLQALALPARPPPYDPWGSRSLSGLRRPAAGTGRWGSVGFPSRGGRACCGRSSIWSRAACLR